MSLEGKTVDGRYRLAEFLGEGGFGQVYRAEHRILGAKFRDLAFKVFKKGTVSEANAAEAFNDAIVLADVLDRAGPDVRPAFIQVFDIGVLEDVEGRGFVAMELVRGGDLAGEIGKMSAFPLSKALDFITQICKALAFMHGLNPPILHRDLKPANVLLQGGVHVKIADFGLAIPVDAILGDAGSAGTLSYQAPESYLHHTSTPATDVYAIGLILYEMLTTQNPFNAVGRDLDPDDDSAEARMRRSDRQLESRRRGLPPLANLNVELKGDADLQQIMDRMIAFDPGERFRDAAEILRALEAYAAGRRAAEPAARSPRARMELLLAEGRRLWRRERHQEALDAWSEARLALPAAPEPYAAMARGFLELQKVDDAVVQVQDGLKHGESGDLFAILADAYEKLGNAALAQTFRRKSHECRRA